MLLKKVIEINTDEGKDTYVNLTESINAFIAETDIQTGVCYVISPHTTCSVIYEEFSHDRTNLGEEYLLADMSDILDQMVPEHNAEALYRYPGIEHMEAVRGWPNAASYLPTNSFSDLWNGDAHIKSSIVGNHVVVDVENGQLNIGKTGSVYFIDFDRTRDRLRKATVILIGE